MLLVGIEVITRRSTFPTNSLGTVRRHVSTLVLITTGVGVNGERRQSLLTGRSFFLLLGRSCDNHAGRSRILAGEGLAAHKVGSTGTESRTDKLHLLAKIMIFREDIELVIEIAGRNGLRAASALGLLGDTTIAISVVVTLPAKSTSLR